VGVEFGSKSKIALTDEALRRDWQAVDHSNLSNVEVVGDGTPAIIMEPESISYDGSHRFSQNSYLTTRT
jgi:hypothetical protein